jgi:DNA-binding transcriptional regulator YhcF (GntR family)
MSHRAAHSPAARRTPAAASVAGRSPVKPSAAGSAGATPLASDISVDRDAEIPIGVQLAWALRSRIRDGRFQPGQRLPGLRDVAEATGVNVNTVRSVYQRLEQEGLIDSQQGSGTFVASTPQPASTVASIAADAAREARETGVDPREVAAALYVSPAAGGQPADEAAERRRMLRQQIAALERTLGELEAKHPGVAPVGESSRAGIGPTLLDAGELEHVRTGLLRRLTDVQAAIDGLVDVASASARDARSTRDARARTRAARTDGADTQPTAAGKAPAKRQPRTKPDSSPAPRARPTMRPAPEGA